MDNPEEFAKLTVTESKGHIQRSLNYCGSHNDIAKALKTLYGDEFVCSSVSNKTWYQFIDHKWEHIEDGVFLRKKISDTGKGTILHEFSEANKQICNELMQEEDMTVASAKQKQQQKIMRLIINLKSAPFKGNVMKEAVDVFYDKDFRNKLDTDPYIIGFQNGVYDLKKNVFREGRPSDYISKCMPIQYKDYKDDDPDVQAVNEFLEKIFPNKNIRKYFMDTTSDLFVGGNHQKTVNFWLGEGDNGKSVTQSILEQMLGPLSIKFPTTVVTGKKPSSGAACAELARAGGGIRLAVIEEPNGDEMINVGVLKHLSGNDTFYARDLFEKGKDGREIVPMFKLAFICNKLPRLKFSDQATFNRIKVIPFESTFADKNVPDTYEEQLKQKRFPKDRSFSKKIPSMLPAFAWVLLKHRLNIVSREEPEEVTIATSLYQKQNDVYRQFEEELTIQDCKGSIFLDELYSQFKEWFKENNPQNTVPIRNDVRDHFIKTWGSMATSRKWNGRRFKRSEEINGVNNSSSSSKVGSSQPNLDSEDEIFESDVDTGFDYI